MFQPPHEVELDRVLVVPHFADLELADAMFGGD